MLGSIFLKSSRSFGIRISYAKNFTISGANFKFSSQITRKHLRFYIIAGRKPSNAIRGVEPIKDKLSG